MFVPPLALKLSAIFVLLVPVLVLLIRAPYVVCPPVAFAPLALTLSAVFVFDAAAVPVAAIETTFPELTELLEISAPLPVVKLLAVI